VDNTPIKIDILGWKCLRVTPATLFKKKDYQGLTDIKQWQKAIDSGWRFDMNLNKFYRLIQ
jgi:hypothetical protein